MSKSQAHLRNVAALHTLAFMNNRPNPPQPPLEEPKQPAPLERPTEPKPEVERPLVDPVPPQEDLPRMSPL